MPPLFIGAVIGWVAGLLGNVGSALVSVAAVVWPIVERVWTAFKFVFDKTAKAIGHFATAAARFTQHVWFNYLGPFFGAVWKLIERFASFLDSVFGPVLDIIEDVYGWIEHILDRVIFPILDAIRRARLFFSGLAALGVKWAKRVDDILATIETQIIEGLNFVLKSLNIAVQWINYLADPHGWIQPQPFLLSIWRWAGGVVSILIAAGIDPRTAFQFEENTRKAEGEDRGVTITEVTDRFSRDLNLTIPGVQAAIDRFRTDSTLQR